LIKINVQTGTDTVLNVRGATFSEAVFVPRPTQPGEVHKEDDGVLLAFLTHCELKKSYFVIVDATEMKELARIETPENVPLGLHGSFVPSCSNEKRGL
jgi:carotenoid cleavage dioxygenase-like enzyme